MELLEDRRLLSIGFYPVLPEAETDHLIHAPFQQGVSSESILGVDSNGVPLLSGTDIRDGLPGSPVQGATSEGLPPETRGWETIPGVIRNDGVETYRVEVDANGPVGGVTMENVWPYFIPPEAPPFELRDDGQGGDRVAGDFIFTSGEFRYDTSRPMVDYYENNPDSPAGLQAGPVGTLSIEELDGQTTQFLIGPTVGVLRADIPETGTEQLSPEMVVSPHLINVRTDDRESQCFLRFVGGNLRNLTGPIYENLPDAFDFFIFFSTSKVEKVPRTASSNFNAGVHSSVQVNYTGTGKSLFDNSSLYGSGGRLLGVNVIDAYDRGISGANATHELVHQWSSYTSTSLGLSDGTAHYDNRSSVGSLVGGFEWIDNGDGTFTLNPDEGRNGAHHAAPLDRYMMGLIDAGEVPTMYVYSDELPPPLRLEEPIGPEDIDLTVTIDEIIGIHGPRTPGPADAQRDFNIAFVAESHQRLLNPTEMTFYEILAEHYTKVLPPEEPDPYVGNGWQPVTRFFAEGTTFSSRVAQPGLRLSIAAESIAENAGPAATTGTVTRLNADIDAPLTVTLKSSDLSEAAVPGSVEIPAGQPSASFPIDAVDDGLADQTQTVTITVSAPGFPPGSDMLEVTDDEPVPNRQIRGTKWNDLDGDGERDDGEPGLEGWTIFLDKDLDGKLDGDEQSTLTDVFGDYAFDDPKPGTHVVAEEQQDGWRQTFPEIPPLAPAVAASIHDEPRDGIGDSFNSVWEGLLRQGPTREDRAIVEFDLGSLAGQTLAEAVLDFQIRVNNSGGAQFREFDVRLYAGNGTADLNDFSVAAALIDTVGYSVSAGSGTFSLDVLGALQGVLDGGAPFAGVRVDPIGDDNFPSILHGASLTGLAATAAARWTVELGSQEILTGVDFGNRPLAQVAGCRVFYNNSAFDGKNVAANEQDDAAIATDKHPLAPGGTAEFANYTSYSRGINGIMVDIAKLLNPDELNLDNLGHYFEFRTGNDDEPETWSDAPTPSNVAVRESPDAPNAKRVTIIWDDYAVRDQWLQVTVLADADYTGLAKPEVFSFGNAVGESGNSDADAEVNHVDVALARENPQNFFNPATVTCLYDYNRDARVNATDMLIARSNPMDELTALELIHPQLAPGESPGAKYQGEGSLSLASETPACVSYLDPPYRTFSRCGWIYEFELVNPARRSSEKHHPAAEVVDKLLATYWA